MAVHLFLTPSIRLILHSKCTRNFRVMSDCLRIWRIHLYATQTQISVVKCRVCTDWCVRQCLRVDKHHSELLGLALDDERGLLYYTDEIQGVIAEMTTNGANRREIIRDRNTNPYAIVVDPVSRWTKSQSHHNSRITVYINIATNLPTACLKSVFIYSTNYNGFKYF